MESPASDVDQAMVNWADYRSEALRNIDQMKGHIAQAGQQRAERVERRAERERRAAGQPGVERADRSAVGGVGHLVVEHRAPGDRQICGRGALRAPAISSPVAPRADGRGEARGARVVPRIEQRLRARVGR